MTKRVSFTYAQKFIRNRIKTYKKDIRICLKMDSNRSHAYIPGLMASISLLELLSGLYIGSPYPIGLNGILKYIHRFMDTATYTDERVTILYEMFRHKIAHLYLPYGIFDTHSVKILQNDPQKRITWQINASDRKPPIDIFQMKGVLKESPWPVQYNYKCIVSLYRLKVDIPKSLHGTTGYFAHLKSDPDALDNFTKCMKKFYL